MPRTTISTTSSFDIQLSRAILTTLGACPPSAVTAVTRRRIPSPRHRSDPSDPTPRTGVAQEGFPGLLFRAAREAGRHRSTAQSALFQHVSDFR